MYTRWGRGGKMSKINKFLTILITNGKTELELDKMNSASYNAHNDYFTMTRAEVKEFLKEVSVFKSNHAYIMNSKCMRTLF
jgi:hypothetical protein